MAELDCLNSENELDSSLNSAIEVQSQLNSDSLSSELGENNEISSVLAIDDINSEMDYEESTDSNIGEEGQMDSHLDLPSSSGGKQYTGKDTDNIIVTVDNNNNVIYATLKQIKFNSVSEFPEVGSEHLIYIDHSNKELYAWDSDLSSYYKLIETPDNPETPDIPTKLSEFENDVGFITKDDLPETPKIPEKLSEFINDGDGNSPFATEDFVLQNAGGSGGDGPTVPVVDSVTSSSTTSALSANQGRVLNEKITEVENKIPTNTSDLNNDAGFVSKTVSDLENYTTTDKMNKVLENKANKDQIPDVSNFITKAVSDLENYYTKLQSYTKDEVNSLVSAIPKFSIEVVDSLPVFDISTTTIYLLRTEGSTVGNLFVEFIYVNDSWESLGAQTLDLTGYVTTETLNSAISELDAKKQDTLIAGKNILISNNVISADFPDDEKIVLLESPVRIWNLNSGIYLVPKGATIYYNGATSESAMSYRNDTPSVLIVKYHLNEEGTADLENKRYMLFSYSNEAQSYLGFIQGSTTEVAGSYSTDYCFTRTYKDAVDGIRQNGYVDTKTAQTIKGVKTFEDEIIGTVTNAKADADGNTIADTYLKKTENAVSATKASQDGDGNVIADTYVKTSTKYNRTSVNALTALATWVNNTNIPTLNIIAYWDGRYQTTNNSSNLNYCKNGEIIGTSNAQTINGQKTFTTEVRKTHSTGYSGYRIDNTGYEMGNLPTETQGLGRYITYDKSTKHIAYIQTTVNTSGLVTTQYLTRQATTAGGTTYKQCSLRLNASLTDAYAQLEGRLIPTANNTYDLGSSGNKWRNLYLAGNISDGTNSISVANITKKDGSNITKSSFRTNLGIGDWVSGADTKLVISYAGTSVGQKTIDLNSVVSKYTGEEFDVLISFNGYKDDIYRVYAWSDVITPTSTTPSKYEDSCCVIAGGGYSRQNCANVIIPLKRYLYIYCPSNYADAELVITINGIRRRK